MTAWLGDRAWRSRRQRRRYSLIVEVYRLDATLGQFLALLVVTPLPFVAFKRWSSSSAERPASAGAGALKCRRDG